MNNLIDNYLKFFQEPLSTYFESYAKIYGTQIECYINEDKEGSRNNIEDTDDYTLALGKDKVGFNFSEMKHYQTYAIIDVSSMGVPQHVGIDSRIDLYLPYKEDSLLEKGDIVSFNYLNRKVFYRITSIPSQDYNLCYKVSADFILNKEIKEYIKDKDIGLISEESIIL